MSRHQSGPTVNRGGVSEREEEESRRAFDIAGNAKEKGEEPSPAKRKRGETAAADPAPALDLDSAHQRAS